MDLLQTGKQAKNSILRGIDRVSIPVMETAGAEGKLAIIEDPMGMVYPKPTKDGVTVLSKVFGADRFEELGAQLIKQAADKTAYETGDGTTTTTILSHALTTRVLKLENANTAEVKIGLQKGLQDAINQINKIKKEVDLTTMEQIATVSLNGDVELGKLIAEMYSKVGVHASVEVEKIFGSNSKYEITPGIRLRRGYTLPHYVNNNNRNTCEFDNSNVLIYKGDILIASDISDFIRESNRESKPLLIICNNIDSNVEAQLIRSTLQGVYKVCICIAPEFGELRESVLEDLSIALDCKIHDKENNLVGTLGKVSKIIVAKDNTNILPLNRDSASLRAEYLEALKEDAKDKGEVEQLDRRISSLRSDMVKFYVGAVTDGELNEKFDRVEDAIPALRSAMKDGYVPGGGVALNYVSDRLSPKGLKGDSVLGYNILKDSLKEHMKVILRNAYLEVPEKRLTFGRGYDVKKRKIVNLLKEGIIDPALITKTALTNAVSVANIALNTNILILTDGIGKN